MFEFTARGCLLTTVQGGLLNYVTMKTVLAANREVLLDVQGTNVWLGPAVSHAFFEYLRPKSHRYSLVQSYNSDAITWGALGKPLYSPGSRYGVGGTWEFAIYTITDFFTIVVLALDASRWTAGPDSVLDPPSLQA